MFTIESHRASHDVSYFTARSDLIGLERLRFLQKRKRGKGFVFEAAPNANFYNFEIRVYGSRRRRGTGE